jgi:hypothetical protein
MNAERGRRKANKMNFLKQLISDVPGVSFGRAASAWLIVAVTVWISFFLWKNSHFPDVVTIAALNALALSFYGIGKGLGKAAEIFGKEGMMTKGSQESEVRSQKPE